jgi:uncharacterized protein YlxP (DUF503 family)
MTIGFLQLELLMRDTHSLKDKRSFLLHLKNQVRKKYNVAVAELAFGNEWGHTLIGFTTISNSRKLVHQVLQDIEHFIETGFAVSIIDHQMEML